jgi:hypothetical protein
VRAGELAETSVRSAEGRGVDRFLKNDEFQRGLRGRILSQAEQRQPGKRQGGEGDQNGRRAFETKPQDGLAAATIVERGALLVHAPQIRLQLTALVRETLGLEEMVLARRRFGFQQFVRAGGDAFLKLGHRAVLFRLTIGGPLGNLKRLAVAARQEDQGEDE